MFEQSYKANERILANFVKSCAERAQTMTNSRCAMTTKSTTARAGRQSASGSKLRSPTSRRLTTLLSLLRLNSSHKSSRCTPKCASFVVCLTKPKRTALYCRRLGAGCKRSSRRSRWMQSIPAGRTQIRKSKPCNSR